jgi:Amidase
VGSGNGPAELIEPLWGDHYENSGGWPPACSAAAIAGYPSLTVPAGFVCGLPVGIDFVAPRFQDGRLLQIGRAFERARNARQPPQLDGAGAAEPRNCATSAASESSAAEQTLPRHT